MDNLILEVTSFSITPGSRYRNEGTKSHSGQEFREEYLEPKFVEAEKNKTKLIVNLDGTIGYGTSWLEEVFGGLARKYGKSKVLSILDFISEEEPYLIDDIKEYIKDA